jgi:hypothetical protein
VRIDDEVFNQGITQSDALKGSNQDTRVIPNNFFDTWPTREKKHFFNEFSHLKIGTRANGFHRK